MVAQALPRRYTYIPLLSPLSILVPFARRLSPSFSHSRARGTLAHSSSRPQSTRQRFSRGRPAAVATVAAVVAATLRALLSTRVLRAASFSPSFITFSSLSFYRTSTFSSSLFPSFPSSLRLVSFRSSHRSLRTDEISAHLTG